jgi:hypothetical protein
MDKTICKSWYICESTLLELGNSDPVPDNEGYCRFCSEFEEAEFCNRPARDPLPR